MGTSNSAKINGNKLTNSVEIIKQMCFTLDETRNYITEARLLTTPDAVDLKTKSPQVCVKELSEIIEIIRNKWSPECIISLTTARQNDLMHSTNAQIINALVQQQYVDHDKIHLIEHNNMLRDGNPNVDLLNTDLFHLNNKGVSMLAANIKSVIHRVLKIPLPIRRPRSQFQHRARGRGRGRY